MKYIPIILVIAPILLFTYSCKKSSSSGPGYVIPTDTTGPVINIDSFPLQVGHQWVYNQDGTNNYDTLTAVADTVINGIHTTEMQSHSFIGYFANLSDGFYQIAFKNCNDFGVFNLTESFMSNTIQPDSLYILNPYKSIIKLPIAIDSSWNSWEYDTFWVSPRTWQSYATVTNSAGSFNCAKLYALGPANEVEEYQYFSDKGLIKYVMITAVPSPGHGSSIHVNTYTLSSINF